MSSSSGVRPVARTLYMDNGHLFSHEAQVTEIGHSEIKGKKYTWIKLNETIFHPQGGGQLSDTGTINGIAVDYVHKEKLSETNIAYFDVLHCFSSSVEFTPGQVVKLSVNEVNRYQNSLWHTAAHVLDYILITRFPQLVGDSGQCYPHNAFMKFISKDGIYPSSEEVKEAVRITFAELFQKDLPMTIVMEDGVRKLKLADHAIPCGGTHVKSIKEFGKFEVRKSTYEAKEGKLRVSYDVK